MYKVSNSSAAKITIDADGMMRVTARILKEGVFDYAPKEMQSADLELIDGYVKEYIPQSEFTEQALATLEGKPVIIGDHEWQTSKTAFRGDQTVGAVAGAPRLVDGGIECDFLITDPDTIEKLKHHDLQDVSAGYELDFDATPGTFGGLRYSGIQKNLRFNHVLLLPYGEGRCGTDVRVFNSKDTNNQPGVKSMSKVIKMTVGNRSVEYRFNSDEDAAEAEKMNEDQKAFNAEELGAAMENAAALKKQLDELKVQYDEALKTIEKQKAKIDEVYSASNMETLANEAAEQKQDEEAIMNEAVEDGDMAENECAETKEAVGNAKTFAGRRAAIIKGLFKAMNRSVDDWTQEQIDAAFELRAQSARRRAQNRKDTGKTVLNGTRVPAMNSKTNEFTSARSRMLAPMHAMNKQTKKETC